VIATKPLPSNGRCWQSHSLATAVSLLASQFCPEQTFHSIVPLRLTYQTTRCHNPEDDNVYDFGEGQLLC
jgi:hypothetical protein